MPQGETEWGPMEPEAEADRGFVPAIKERVHEGIHKYYTIAMKRWRRSY